MAESALAKGQFWAACATHGGHPVTIGGRIVQAHGAPLGARRPERVGRMVRVAERH
jgi:hypothetical protein